MPALDERLEESMSSVNSFFTAEKKKSPSPFRGQNQSEIRSTGAKNGRGRGGTKRNKYLHGKSKDGKDLYKLLEC